MPYLCDGGSGLFYCSVAEHVSALRNCSEKTAHRLVKHLEFKEYSYLIFFSTKEQ
jgi:hypothetical protein